MRIAWDTVRVEIKLVGRHRWAKQRAHPWSGGVYDHLLWVVETGRGELRTPRGRYRIGPGSCVWFRPGVAFAAKQGRQSLGMIAVVFSLKDRRGQDLGLATSLPDDVLDDPASGFAQAIAERLLALGGSTLGDGRNTFVGEGRRAAEHLLSGLLMELDRHNDSGPAASMPVLTMAQSAVYDLARRIADNPSTAPAPAEQARRIGVTPTHLCRLYRQLFRRTPGGFIVQFRIRHAQRLLIETDQSLAAIAEAVGYQSQAFFSRQFRRFVGQTPSAFRRG